MDVSIYEDSFLFRDVGTSQIFSSSIYSWKAWIQLHIKANLDIFCLEILKSDTSAQRRYRWKFVTKSIHNLKKLSTESRYLFIYREITGKKSRKLEFLLLCLNHILFLFLPFTVLIHLQFSRSSWNQMWFSWERISFQNGRVCCSRRKNYPWIPEFNHQRRNERQQNFVKYGHASK